MAFDKERMTLWLRLPAFKALKSLAKKHNISRSELVESLIIQENAKT